jgi:hypothetical protein
MKEVLADFTNYLLSDPRLEYIKAGGGIVIATSREVIPLQEKTPYIYLTDGGTAGISHLSSYKRRMPFTVGVHVVQRVFDKEGVIMGAASQKGIEDMAKDVRNVLDMWRHGGKYTSVFLQSEDAPTSLVEGNIHLVEKALTFEVVRIE